MIHRVFLALLLLIPFSVRSQFTPITARELLPNVLSKARTELAQDAHLVNVLFAGFEYNNIQLTLDYSTGKATGWAYRMYSLSRDSTSIYVAVKVLIPPLPAIPQVVQIPTGTSLPQLPVQGNMEFSDPWVDSPTILQAVMNGGGNGFVQTHTDAAVSFAIATENPVENPIIPKGKYWLVTLTSASSNETYSCLVNATTGDAERCGSPTSVHRLQTPATFAIEGPAPNPVSSRSPAVVSITSDRRTHVRVVAVDALGRTQGILFDDMHEGNRKLTLLRSRLGAPGLYFLWISGGDFLRTIPFLVTD